MEARTDNLAPDRSTVCPNCEAGLTGAYCGACGQKRVYSGDLSVRHAWHHLTHELLHFDGKIFHSLKLLLTRPGQLTLDFIEGRRVRHVHPIRLFLVFLFLYFFFAPVNPFLDMGSVMTQQLTANGQLMERLRARAERKGVALETVFDEASVKLRSLSKPLDLAVVLVIGAMLWLLFRKKRPYLAENMTMQLHLASFGMAAQLVVGWLRVVPELRVAASITMAVITIAYFLLAGRRVYAATWTSLVLKYALIVAVQFLLISATLALVYLGHLRSTLA